MFVPEVKAVVTAVETADGTSEGTAEHLAVGTTDGLAVVFVTVLPSVEILLKIIYLVNL